MPELLLRILFAVVAIPVALAAVLKGGHLFRIFISLFLLGGVIEFYLMTKKQEVPVMLSAALIGVTLFCFRGTFIFDLWMLPVFFLPFSCLCLQQRWGGPGQKQHSHELVQRCCLFSTSGFSDRTLL